MAFEPQNDPAIAAKDRRTVEQSQRDQARRQAELEPMAAIRAKQAKTDEWLRNATPAQKQSLRDAGYTGPFGDPRPGPNSGELSTEVKQRVATVVEHKYGSPSVWMDQFKPPMKNLVLAIRDPNQTDIRDWYADCCDRHYNLTTYGSLTAPTREALGRAWQKANGK